MEYQNQIDDIVFKFSNKYELLVTFLSNDVTPFEDWIKEGNKNALSESKTAGRPDLFRHQTHGPLYKICRRDNAEAGSENVAPYLYVRQPDQKNVVTFVKNVDWKNVAIGVTAVIVAVTVLW